ncbi:SapB/AmfS family lanthipeptide [Dactylosporangium sp. McL0621]|uniref:SapB/AmfS family lanthipeptide n=1 Tax=Dactylosporangium sp. McL0621 TaxID=3415678 RepID=UPI003CE6D67E
MALLDLQGLEIPQNGGGGGGGSASSTGCGVESTASLLVCAASSLSLTSCH